MTALGEILEDAPGGQGSLLAFKAPWLPLGTSIGVALLGALTAASGALSSKALFVLLALPTIAVGAVIASKQRHNAIGWLLLAAGLTLQIELLAEAYVDKGDHLATDAGRWVAWLTTWMWILPFCLTGIVLPLLFPNGRALTSRWKPALWAASLGLLAVVLSTAVLPGRLSDLDATNPIGLAGMKTVLNVVRFAGIAVILVCFVAAGTSLVLRFRRAARDERRQIEWLAYIVTVIVAGFVVSALTSFSSNRWLQLICDVSWDLLLVASIFGLPIAIGAAILRYHLYGIDWIINRTLVYVPLTALLAGIYVCLTGVLKTVITEETATTSEFSVALTTIVVVSSLTPAKNFLQERVDRRFKEQRNPAAELDSLAAQSAAYADLLDRRVYAERFLENTRRALGATGAMLTLEAGKRPRVSIAGLWDGERALAVPLVCDGVRVGLLEVDQRRNGRPYTEAEKQALERYAGAAARLLTLELR